MITEDRSLVKTIAQNEYFSVEAVYGMIPMDIRLHMQRVAYYCDANQAYMPGYKEMKVNKQGANYYFSNDNGKTYTAGESDVLFRIPTNEPAEITMYIRLEGADKDCVNAIMGSEIDVHLRFISKDIE